MINLAMATAAEADAIKTDMPFPECGAMSQGYIGYHLQKAIGNELASRGMNKAVATIVTQFVVMRMTPLSRTPPSPSALSMTRRLPTASPPRRAIPWWRMPAAAIARWFLPQAC